MQSVRAPLELTKECSGLSHDQVSLASKVLFPQVVIIFLLPTVAGNEYTVQESINGPIHQTPK